MYPPVNDCFWHISEVQTPHAKVCSLEKVGHSRGRARLPPLTQLGHALDSAVSGYNTRNAAGQRMLDDTMLNAVLVLMLATSILGPALTERLAPRMRNGPLGGSRPGPSFAGGPHSKPGDDGNRSRGIGGSLDETDRLSESVRN